MEPCGGFSATSRGPRRLFREENGGRKNVIVAAKGTVGNQGRGVEKGGGGVICLKVRHSKNRCPRRGGRERKKKRGRGVLGEMSRLFRGKRGKKNPGEKKERSTTQRTEEGAGLGNGMEKRTVLELRVKKGEPSPSEEQRE